MTALVTPGTRWCEGLGRTGRLVTSAAAILMLSFLSMSTGPQTDLKILATGLGAGILIDAVVVRCLLVPALVALFGRANWWLPSWLARVLRIPARAGRPAAELASAAHQGARGVRGAVAAPGRPGQAGAPAWPGSVHDVTWHNPHLTAEPIMGGAS